MFVYEESEDKQEELPEPKQEPKTEIPTRRRYLSEDQVKPQEKEEFPIVSINGQKSKWRIQREQDEERVKQQLKEKGTYHTSNPPKYTTKELKK